MIKKSLLWSYRIAYIALGTMVFVGLLSIIVLRYFILPHIDDYKPKIVQGLTQILGQKVTIGNIYANWDALNPHLSIFNVDIYDKQNRLALSLQHIEGSLSWTSIPLLEPRLASFTIYRPELTIRREKDGTVYVAGVSMSGPSKPEFPNWLLRQAQVNVVDANIVWQDDLRGAPALNLDQLNLQLENPAWDSLRGRHLFSLRATPSAATSKPIDIRGKVFGKDISQIEQWYGTLYSKIEGTDIAAWRNWLDYPFDLREGHGAAQFWMDFADNQVDSLTTDISLNKVATRLPYNDTENRFNRIAGRFKWMRHRDGQEIQGEGIKIVTADDLNMRSGKFSIRERISKQEQSLDGDVLLDEIQLETLNKLTPYFTLPNKVAEALKETDPLGKLSNLHLSWHSKGENLAQYALSADFAGLSLKPYSNYSLPGFTNLTGKIDINQKQGKLTLNSQAATLNFTPVLRWPLPADKLTGQVDWTINNQVLDLEVNRLTIKNEHLEGELDARFTSDGTKHYLDLTGHASKADLKYGRFYYPNSISADTVAWLDKSILSGRGEDVNVRIKGDLKDYPFDGNKHGILKVTANIKDAVLDYTDGWPKAEGINLAMLFEGKRMELNASAGHFFGNEIKKAKITIPDLETDDNMLDIVGELQSPVSEGVKFINASPIAKLANGFTDSLKTSGTGKLNLNLHIPLNNTDATKVKGTYLISNGSMLADSIPELTKLNGTVEFTESAINANNINTWAYGAPAVFSVNTDKNHIIQITAHGRVTDAGLRKSFASLVPSTLAGSADWSAKAQIANKQSEVSIRSNLVGLSSQLPAPFGKATADATPLLIEKKPLSETQDSIKVSLGSAIGAKFIRSSQNGISKIDRGDIGINIPPEISNQKGVSLRANLDSLDIDEWLAQLDKSAANNPPNAITINRIELSTNHLDLFDRRINALKLNAKSADNAWIMNLKSDEITGDLKWSQDGNGKISGNLANLIFPSPTPDAVKAPAHAAAKQLNLKYPALDIAADNFEMGKKKLGRLELQAKEQFGNWGIDKLRLSSADGVINANGEWNNWKNHPNTKLRFNWEINDMGKALKRLDFGDVIKGGSAEITGQLKWAGSPHEFNVPNLSGSVHLEAKKGQILQVEPGVGRLFSILSLQNLPRRLTLDFKDLFSSGFGFDKITADVNIERGVMYSDNFKMDGPTASVEIKGETDLDKETQHFYIKVKPYISDTLSLAAFAGGPAVGAAAYIAQKILKDPLNKIAETQYEIVGTWSNPQEKESKTAPATNSNAPLGK
ncbi:MAG: YhdP family protein [Candidatus Methylopumilus sp.]